MLQRRRGSSCAASRTIGGCTPTITMFEDWRSARREIRNSTLASVFEAVCCLSSCYLIVIEHASSLTINSNNDKYPAPLLHIRSSYEIHILLAVYIVVQCACRRGIGKAWERVWSAISVRTPRPTDYHCPFLRSLRNEGMKGLCTVGCGSIMWLGTVRAASLSNDT